MSSSLDFVPTTQLTIVYSCFQLFVTRSRIYFNFPERKQLTDNTNFKMVSSLTLLALASSALALKVTSPDSSTIWSTGEKQTIKWETVSSDESSFNIYLSNKATYPPTDVLLASDVASSDGSFDIDGSKLTDGDSYTINFTNGTKTEQIYAQSVSFKPPRIQIL